MGCDIHIWVERFENERSMSVSESHALASMAPVGCWFVKDVPSWPDRNYRLFSFLSNVRGNDAPAGHPTGWDLDKDGESLERQRLSFAADLLRRADDDLHGKDIWYVSELKEYIEDLNEASGTFVAWLEKHVFPLSRDSSGQDVRLMIAYDS